MFFFLHLHLLKEKYRFRLNLKTTTYTHFDYFSIKRNGILCRVIIFALSCQSDDLKIFSWFFFVCYTKPHQIIIVPKQLVYYLSLMILFEISSRSFPGLSWKSTKVTNTSVKSTLTITSMYNNGISNNLNLEMSCSINVAKCMAFPQMFSKKSSVILLN